ncbi:MAG: glycoside hydrolase family 3 C-terminal domain-containing protein, partial [Cellulomonas sp.]|nr:glycoside hydrolase family 3 C-terminal domain-containing protein [Cellulomonas sp.]
TLVRNTGVLPLDPHGSQRVALIGGYARLPRIQGGGSAGVRPTWVDTPLEALRAALGDRLAFAEGYPVGESDYYQEQVPAALPSVGQLADEAVALAARSDVVVAVVGLPLAADSEAADRTDLALPADQVALLTRLAALDVPLVVVVSAGAAVTMDPWHDGAAAVLLTGLAGQGVGGAVADVLLGAADPGGRLTETYPLSLADTPGAIGFPGERGHIVYGEGVFVGYRWYDALDRAVRYPFGHGLSYTTFAYDDLRVDVLDAAAGRVRCTVTVTNTGSRRGSEVVQVYVGDPLSAVHRPVRELKGYAKVTLEAGGSERVVVDLAGRDFSYVDAACGRWRREGGQFVVSIGSSSRDLRASAVIELPDGGDATVPALVPDEEMPTDAVPWAVGTDGPARTGVAVP